MIILHSLILADSKQTFVYVQALHQGIPFLITNKIIFQKQELQKHRQTPPLLASAKSLFLFT